MHCDINSDLGEGFRAWTMGDDAALLAVVTSANVVGDHVRYVKPHGPLYHSACQDEDVAAVIVTVGFADRGCMVVEAFT